MKIKIVADSTCDLSEELVKKYNIRIVPLSISKGDEMLRDGLEIKPRDIFDYMESGKGLCKTSAVNAAEYMEVYQEERAKHDAVLHFIISSEMSLCYQNALAAAEDFDNIYIYDTRNLSTGIGHLAILAAEMAEDTPPDEIDKVLKKRIQLLDVSFVINTLTYLHKGGRCSAVQKYASSVLRLKPCIEVKNGKMGVAKKYRGPLKSVLVKYIEDKLTDTSNIDPGRIFVTHTMPEENRELVEMVKEQVKAVGYFDEILETTAGGTVSCHCGPNTLGVLFFRKS